MSIIIVASAAGGAHAFPARLAGITVAIRLGLSISITSDEYGEVLS